MTSIANVLRRIESDETRVDVLKRREISASRVISGLHSSVCAARAEEAEASLAQRIEFEDSERALNCHKKSISSKIRGGALVGVKLVSLKVKSFNEMQVFWGLPNF